MEERNLYNQVTLYNFDDEDFVIELNKNKYLLRAGETRDFPKFIAQHATKHFIDHMANKEDPKAEKNLIALPHYRKKIASQFVLGEKKYEEPRLPTDQEIVDKMNEPSEMDIALKSKVETPNTNLIPEPEVNTQTQEVPVTNEEEKHETFDQIEEEQGKDVRPSREVMLDYFKNEMKIHHMTIRKMDKELSDDELYKQYIEQHG